MKLCNGLIKIFDLVLIKETGPEAKKKDAEKDKEKEKEKAPDPVSNILIILFS